MQGSRFARALVCAAGLLIAAPAFAFGGGHGGGGADMAAALAGAVFTVVASTAASAEVGSTALMPVARMAATAAAVGTTTVASGTAGIGTAVAGLSSLWLGYGYPYDLGYDYPDDDWYYSYDIPIMITATIMAMTRLWPWRLCAGPTVGYTPGPQASGQLGRYCRTPVKTCQLYNASTVGAGCSCRKVRRALTVRWCRNDSAKSSRVRGRSARDTRRRNAARLRSRRSRADSR